MKIEQMFCFQLIWATEIPDSAVFILTFGISSEWDILIMACIDLLSSSTFSTNTCVQSALIPVFVKPNFKSNKNLFVIQARVACWFLFNTKALSTSKYLKIWSFEWLQEYNQNSFRAFFFVFTLIKGKSASFLPSDSSIGARIIFHFNHPRFLESFLF